MRIVAQAVFAVCLLFSVNLFAQYPGPVPIGTFRPFAPLKESVQKTNRLLDYKSAARSSLQAVTCSDNSTYDVNIGSVAVGDSTIERNQVSLCGFTNWIVAFGTAGIPAGSDFKIVKDTCSGSVIADGISCCNIHVEFAPSRVGLQGAVLSVPFSSTNTTTGVGYCGTVSFEMRGNGIGSSTPLQLSIAQDGSAFSAIPSETTSNQKISVKPNVPTTINVKVTGSGFKSTEDRIASVSLSVGSNSFVSSIALSHLKSVGGTALVPFTHTFPVDEAGEVELNASVSTQDDSDFSDNAFADKMYVLCKVEDYGRTVPFYSQADGEWAGDFLGISTTKKIGGFGCSITSFAMLAKSYGIKRTPLGSPLEPFSTEPGLQAEEITPKTINLAFRHYKKPIMTDPTVALNSFNNPIWAGMAEVARAGYKAQCTLTHTCNPNDAANVIKFNEQTGFLSTGFINAPNSVHHKKMYKHLCAGNPVIMKFKSTTAAGQHYMLAKGMTVDEETGKVTYILNDPALPDGDDTIFSGEFKTKYSPILGYSIYTPAPSPSPSAFSVQNFSVAPASSSIMTITTPLHAHIVVTDPYGRRTGFDPISDTTYSEIPGASYGVQSISTPAEPEFVPDVMVAENYFSSSEDVPAGEYRVQVYSLEGGSYYVDYRATDTAGDMNEFSLKSGSLGPRQSTNIEFTHSTDPLQTTNADLEVSHYVLNQLKKGFLDIGVVLGGRIVPRDGSKLQLNDQFSLKVGGDEGLNLALSAKQFKTTRIFKQTRYIYAGRDMNVYLDDTGRFEVVINKTQVRELSQDAAKNISIEVDLNKADAVVPLRCSKNVCVKSR